MKIHLALRSTLVILSLILAGCSTTLTPPTPFAGSAVSTAGADPLPS